MLASLLAGAFLAETAGQPTHADLREDRTKVIPYTVTITAGTATTPVNSLINGSNINWIYNAASSLTPPKAAMLSPISAT